MVTINVFPPPDASQKQTEQNNSFSAGPEPGNFQSAETAGIDSNLPTPSLQIQELTAGNEELPQPTLQISSFQDQGLSSADAPVPSMDFLNLTGGFQSAPDPVFNPESDQNTDAMIPSPSMLPPGENTEGAGKSLSKKK
ncbi:hypothetical protein [Dyadobacter sp. LHD-138]|uniref:hypothetical protein n=1 Tax=Dyadobacter sp. LHD-138 TaxID=3071413 RepID=UPI0027E0E5F6|nr:hypothetical protein [Dyadobacter sp. LHD-138]MDQ6478416.1 hypothetical protein [Dyadobacter sp. LHD-138]